MIRLQLNRHANRRRSLLLVLLPYLVCHSFAFSSRPPFTTAPSRLFSSSESDQQPSGDQNDGSDESIDVSLDNRLYKVRLSRAPGIDWGTDLSFSFVYVRGMDPSGEAAMSGRIRIGDQLCELTPINRETGEPHAPPINLLGAPFDFVMDSFVGLDKVVRDVDVVFFRGTKEELKALCAGGTGSGEAETITVTVVQNKGAADEKVKTLTAKAGVNVRELLVDNGINVYQSVTRWTNCKGKQLCGTCIVNITEGSLGTNQKSLDEASTLRENPDSYRLSCVLFAYDDITVETFPPIKAAQWTR